MNKAKHKSRRAKGDGTIFQNKKGRWIARFTKKGQPTKEFSAKTRAEVKRKLDDYKILVITGDIINSKLSLEQYAKKFLLFKRQQVTRKKLKNTTYDRLETIYTSHIESHPISKILMCNLTGSDIQNLIDGMMPNFSFSTVKKAYLFIHALVRFGISEHDFPDEYNPFVNVELPDESAMGVQTKKIEIIPEKYIDIFCQTALSRDVHGELCFRYGPALVFMLNTGLRLGELLAISKTGLLNYDSQNSIYISETISTVKNRDDTKPLKYSQIITSPKYPRSRREIPLNKVANECIEIMISTYGINHVREDLIITTKSGRVPLTNNIQHTFDRILKKCDMPHYDTHALRHTFATHLLIKTSTHQDIKAVAELLGDDYMVVVRTYLHTDNREKIELVNMLCT